MIRRCAPADSPSRAIDRGASDRADAAQSAMQSDDERQFRLYRRQGRTRSMRRGVTTGEVSERGVAITSGLTGTERVVLTAGAFLNPGQKVKPDPAKAEVRGELRMSFRNISAWSIRNPVPSHRPVHCADDRRARQLRHDGRQQRSGHRFPGRDRSRSRSPAPRRPSSRTRSPRRSRRRSAACRASTRSTRPSPKAIRPDRRPARHRHADRSRGRGRAQRDPADPRRPARRHPRAAGRPRRYRQRQRHRQLSPRSPPT